MHRGEHHAVAFPARVFDIGRAAGVGTLVFERDFLAARNLRGNCKKYFAYFDELLDRIKAAIVGTVAIRSRIVAWRIN